MAAKTKDRILLTALDVFAERGFEGTTTRDICHRAGVNIAALNYHWSSKDRLWSEACDWAGSTLILIAQRSFHRASTIQQCIERGMGALFDSLLQDPRPLRIIVWSSLHPALPDDGRQGRVLQELAQQALLYLRPFVDEDGLPGVDCELAFVGSWGMLVAAFIEPPSQRAFLGAGLGDPEHAARVRKSLITTTLSAFGLPTHPSPSPADALQRDAGISGPRLESAPRP